jgi:nucleoside-diphosphate-sugar epimerase
MPERIFLAGASGAVGARLVPLLVAAGYGVFGTTRSAAKARALERAGATPVILDVFDAADLMRAMVEIRPSIAIHQLTDLPPGLDPAGMAAALPRNARIRDEGTRNLVAASLASGAGRLIAQSIAWAYAPGSEPHAEEEPLDVEAADARGITVRGVAALERQVLHTPGLDGVVLRYGQLYGPGTGFDSAAGKASPVHVDAAAAAAHLAIGKARTGVFNVAEPNAHVATDKVRRALGWDHAFRLPSR